MRGLGSALVSARPANRSGDIPIAYEATPALPFFNRTDAQDALVAYLSDPTLFASIDRLVTDVANWEWDLFRKAASGRDEDRELVQSHAMIDLWDEPNPFWDRTEFLELAWLYYEAAAESYIVIGMDDRFGLPQSLWPVRPDFMAPVTSADRFLVGYVYRDPHGNQVPFPVEQVIKLSKPNPLDPYRGAGAVRALMTDLEGSVAAAQWNRNFFANSAEPGGIITVEDFVEDRDFERINAQWNANHRGAANSHRVAVLSQGMSWIPRAFTNRDMQFVELRGSSDEHIMLGLGMSKTLLGQTEGVNRATAEAAEYVYGKYRLDPRLKKLRGILNRKLLSRYPSNAGRVLEWDYPSPITGNVDDEATERDSKMSAAAELIAMGADPSAVMEALDLPRLEFGERPAAVAQPMQVIQPPGAPAEPEPEPDPPAARAIGPGPRGGWAVRVRNAGDPPDLDPSELPDVTPLQASFEDTLEELIAEWADLENTQKADLVAQVLAIAGAGSIAELAEMTIDTEATAELLADAMEAMAIDGAEALAAEAAEQGVTVEPVVPDRETIDGVAVVAAGLIAGRLIASAQSTAMRINSPTTDPDAVAEGVERALADLSIDTPRPQLSAALTGSQNDGRLATLRSAPSAALYASEVNDANTCGPCREVDGKWLGNTEDLDQVTELYPGGAYGGYVDCEGRERCRGTITGVWRRGRS